jgi:hypothetical protein
MKTELYALIVTTILVTLWMPLWMPIDRVNAQSAPSFIPEEVPEEVLRQEIILDARSPLDGKPLTATEYAELQVEIEQHNQTTPQVSPKLRQLVGLLKFRKLIKRVLPMIPIK